MQESITEYKKSLAALEMLEEQLVSFVYLKFC